MVCILSMNLRNIMKCNYYIIQVDYSDLIQNDCIIYQQIIHLQGYIIMIFFSVVHIEVFMIV